MNQFRVSISVRKLSAELKQKMKKKKKKPNNPRQESLLKSLLLRLQATSKYNDGVSLRFSLIAADPCLFNSNKQTNLY